MEHIKFAFILFIFVFTLDIYTFKNKKTNLSKVLLNFLRDCYTLFTGLPVFNPVCKDQSVSWKFHRLGLLREKVLQIIDLYGTNAH
jgi:hypothetical protein